MKLNDSRRRLLRAVYEEMRANPRGFGLHISNALAHGGTHADFELAYLVDSGLIVRRGLGYLKLTPDGVDAIEGAAE